MGLLQKRRQARKDRATLARFRNRGLIDPSMLRPVDRAELLRLMPGLRPYGFDVSNPSSRIGSKEVEPKEEGERRRDGLNADERRRRRRRRRNRDNDEDIQDDADESEDDGYVRVVTIDPRSQRAYVRLKFIELDDEPDPRDDDDRRPRRDRDDDDRRPRRRRRDRDDTLGDDDRRPGGGNSGNPNRPKPKPDKKPVPEPPKRNNPPKRKQDIVSDDPRKRKKK